MEDLDGISILEDTPLPKPQVQYKSTFDNILKSVNIAIDPSQNDGASVYSVYSSVGKSNRKLWS